MFRSKAIAKFKEENGKPKNVCRKFSLKKKLKKYFCILIKNAFHRTKKKRLQNCLKHRLSCRA
jgi:hypothetical protein